MIRGRRARGSLEPVEYGHLDVHADHVWRERKGLLDGGLTVSRLPDDLQARLGLQDDAEAASDEVLVVGEEDAVR